MNIKTYELSFIEGGILSRFVPPEVFIESICFH